MDQSLTALRGKKEEFLSDVQSDIRSYIRSTGNHCINIIEMDAENEDTIYCTWRASMDTDFCKILYRFVRKKGNRGRALDSALTQPVCRIVTEHYEKFYTDNADTVSAGILEALTKDHLILDSFVGRLADKALEKASKEVRERVVHIIVEQIHDSTATGTQHTIGHGISHVAATAAGTQVGAVLANVLLKLLAAHIGAIVAKIMSSALLKKLIVLLVKKVVITAVGAAVLNFLAVHVGVAIGGSTVMWIVAPLLLTYVGYKIYTFPEKIAEEVSNSVRKELSGRFDGMNESILDKIFDQIVNGEELVLAIAKNGEFQTMITDLAMKV
jgi:hypothetical protein